MNQEEFENAIHDQLATCQELLFSKSDSYNEGDDKLRNFRVAAVLQGVTIEAALGGMLAKHIVSIYDMIDGAIENYWVGTWEEKIADAINYLLILKAMVAERYHELEDGPEVGKDPRDEPAEVVEEMEESWCGGPGLCRECKAERISTKLREAARELEAVRAVVKQHGHDTGDDYDLIEEYMRLSRIPDKKD